MTISNDEVKLAFLQAFADAWNRHDVDALMEFMTDDCVYETSSGPDVCGTRYEGQQAVREGFASVWESFPDAQWLGARHFIVGSDMAALKVNQSTRPNENSQTRIPKDFRTSGPPSHPFHSLRRQGIRLLRESRL